MVARKLGISLRRFLGWEPVTYRDPATGRTTSEPEFDAWERALWRALDEWEADRCPGCGQSLTESLWDPKKPASEQAKWRAGYDQCRACLELENAQNKVAADDEQLAKTQGAPVPHGHRKWVVARDDERGR